MPTAAQVTNEVQDRVERALERLNEDFNGRIVNGYGVYADPSRQRRALSAAIAELTAARDLLAATDWPVD